jgi:CrcB protein
MMLAIAVGLGAAAGAVARYLLDRAVAERRASPFPVGTWLINISGAFVLGLLVGLAAHHGLGATTVAVIGTGVCGGYTTFSTFSYETIRLAEEGSPLLAAANIAGSLLAGLLAAAAGMALALL